MTQYEIYRNTIEHRGQTERLFYADFIPSVLESFCEYEHEDIGRYGVFSPEYLQPEGAVYVPAEEFLPYFDNVPEGAWINMWGVMEVPCDTYHFTRYISPGRNMTSLEELKGLPIADYGRAYIPNGKERVIAAHKDGRVTACWVGHMYEEAWQIRGYTEFLTDMLTASELCDYLLDRIAENNLSIGRQAAEAGADIIKIGDDVANQRSMMFGTELWQRFMKPRWGYFISEVKKINPDVKIWYHSDGNIRDIIPQLIEIGVDILNPVQPECLNVEEMLREYGRDLVFDGCIGTQSLMPFGTPEEIKAEIKRLNGLFRNGGLILSPTHVLEPDVPMENIRAFFEACRENNQK